MPGVCAMSIMGLHANGICGNENGLTRDFRGEFLCKLSFDE